ncbi:MAG TPA: LPXTG cell wall anchor domain-containing protein [Chitinophagaceae bacterium]
MIRQIFYTIISFLLPLFLATMVSAQSGITVSATVDKNRVLIGEHIVLTLKADIPESEAINFFSIDTLDHFEFLEKQKIDSVNTSTGTILTQVIRITSFDSGHWVIPSFYLADSSRTDSIPMDVVFTPDFDPNKAYHDIKDVMDVKVQEEQPWWWWYAIGAGILLLLLVIYFLMRKKKKPVAAKPEIIIDPYKDAMEQLEQAQKNKDNSKQYYTTLVDIFRQYIYRKKGIQSQQKTTDDLIIQLRNISLNKEDFDKLAQALRLSDFVKFAKYQPGKEDDTNMLETIINTIKTIEKSEPASSPSGK